MGLFDSFVNLPIALGKKNTFHKDSVNVTTCDYLKFKPILSRLVMPNEKIKVDASQFTRLTPMLKPAFANATFENRAFFVPYRVVYKDFNNLVSASRNDQGVVPEEVGTIDVASLLAFFKSAGNNNRNPFIEVLNSSNVGVDALKKGGYDFCYPDAFTGTSSCKFYRFKAKGKQVIDILVTLGYNFPYYLPESYFDWDDLETVTDDGDQIYSAPVSNAPDYTSLRPSTLPLASLLKVYFDFYMSPRSLVTAYNLYIEQVISEVASSKFIGASLTAHQKDVLLALFSFLITIYYDDDYFQVASPTYMDTFGTAGTIQINDPSYTALPNSLVESKPTNPNTGSTTPHVNGSTNSGAAYNLTQFILDSMCSLTKWMRRNNIVGWRPLDRYLAHYGINLEAAKLNRCLPLGKFVTTVDIDAIFQQDSGSEPQPLGSYAGAGVGGGSGSFSYSADEFGQLIVVSVCKPDVAYYQGVKRELLDTKRFDFFTPEFDNLGYQAVASGELSNSVPYNYSRVGRGASVLPVDPTSVFGFVPRYAHLKCSTNQDVLSGDFRINSAGARSYDYFHQFRSIGNLGNIADSWIIDDNFRQAKDSSQYDRIFANQDSIYDHFICFFSFKVTSYAPMMKLFDSLDFGDELHDGHQKRNVRVGGTKF